MSNSKWVLKPQHDVSSLVNTGLSPIVLNILKNRGLNTENEIQHFINPNIEDLHDPFLMKGVAEAVTRIRRAINNRESICVFGDYD